MALAEDQRMDYGFIRDDERRLVVTTEGEGHMDQGFLRDDDGRLIVTGIEGGGGGAASMGTVYHGEEADAERPTGYAAITWIGSVEPENATEHDIWIEA